VNGTVVYSLIVLLRIYSLTHSGLYATLASAAYVKIVFRTYRHQKWIDLCQTKTRMIANTFYTYRRIHFISRNAFFV